MQLKISVVASEELNFCEDEENILYS